MIDTADRKLLVATSDAANAQMLSLFRCDLDGANCARFDISAGQGARSGAPHPQ